MNLHIARRLRYVPALPQVKALAFKISLYEGFFIVFLAVIFIIVFGIFVSATSVTRFTSFVCEASFLAKLIEILAICFMVGHCLEILDYTAIIGGNSVKAVDGIDFFSLTFANVLNNGIEYIVSAITHAKKKEFHAIGNVVDEVCDMVEFKFTEILCFGYKRRVDNEEEGKSEDLIVCEKAVFVLVLVDSFSYGIHEEGVATNLESCRIALIVKLIPEELSFIGSCMVEECAYTSIKIEGICKSCETQELGRSYCVSDVRIVCQGLDESCFSVDHLFCVHSEPPKISIHSLNYVRRTLPPTVIAHEEDHTGDLSVY